jgi:hypothetical protein
MKKLVSEANKRWPIDDTRGGNRSGDSIMGVTSVLSHWGTDLPGGEEKYRQQFDMLSAFADREQGTNNQSYLIEDQSIDVRAGKNTIIPSKPRIEMAIGSATNESDVDTKWEAVVKETAEIALSGLASAISFVFNFDSLTKAFRQEGFADTGNPSHLRFDEPSGFFGGEDDYITTRSDAAHYSWVAGYQNVGSGWDSGGSMTSKVKSRVSLTQI